MPFIRCHNLCVTDLSCPVKMLLTWLKNTASKTGTRQAGRYACPVVEYRAALLFHFYSLFPRPPPSTLDAHNVVEYN